jgi:hypothetical protein
VAATLLATTPTRILRPLLPFKNPLAENLRLPALVTVACVPSTPRHWRIRTSGCRVHPRSQRCVVLKCTYSWADQLFRSFVWGERDQFASLVAEFVSI